MSGLPEQEAKYTKEDMDHMVAREVAKQRLSDLERNLEGTNQQVIKMFAKFDLSFESLQKVIEGQDEKIRKEIERDFATKLDLAEVRSEISKVWLKVSIPVSTVLILVGLVSKYFN